MHTVAWRCCWAALGLTGLRTGALPRPLAIAALATAGVDALAPLVLALPKAALVIPAGRYPSFVIMGITGFRLARGRKGAETQKPRGEDLLSTPPYRRTQYWHHPRW